MSDMEYILRSLERLAEGDIDVVPEVYAQFFAACPEAKPLFATREAQAVQGKMVNELIQTVVDRLEGKPYSAVMVQTMVSDHDGWGVRIAMYDAFLDAFVAAVRDALQWTEAAPEVIAWRRQLAALRQDIAAQLATSTAPA